MEDACKTDGLHCQSGDHLITIETDWRRLLEIISAESGRKIVYVIGANDSGKSTFCHFLIDHLSEKFLTAYIDGDPGQSSIGPPTTVGLKLYKNSNKDKHDPFLWFIGATTPRGHLLQTLAGIKKLSEKAIQLGAQRIIIDSCGFVLDRAAREFQFQLIHLLQPDHIAVFETNPNIIKWLSNFRRHPAIEVHRFPISKSVIPRTIEQRKQYRDEKFKQYFETAKLQEIHLQQIGFYGRVPDLKNPGYFRNRLVALCDAENYVLTLGIAQEIDLANKKFRLIAPEFCPNEVAFIYFGSMYLSGEGKQILRTHSTKIFEDETKNCF
ncbi:MAG: polynucleotide 5'-hydroxyl-kinase [bacterium]|nr:polynucleotide 5'-hydroxyl-kinase [bacterium]